MNDALTRASAIQELIRSGDFPASVQPVAEAAIACCDELIKAGEPRLAIALINAASNLPYKSDPSWALRLGLIHAHSLSIVGEFNDSLELIKRLSHEHAHILSGRSLESYQLEIATAKNLWGLNRVDEAIAILERVRSELLKLPDSYLLARCAFELASAQTMRGEYRLARRYSLEAIVSARRSESRYLEALSLQTMALLERSACHWFGAKEASEEALRLSRVDGNAILECNALRALAIGEWKRGSLEEAKRLVEKYNSSAAGLGNGLLSWFGSLLKGMIILHSGRFSEATAMFTSGAKWDVPESQTRPSLLTTEFLGDVHLEQGQAEPALRYYDEVWPKALALVPKGDIVAELRRRRAECYYLLGRFEDAYR